MTVIEVEAIQLESGPDAPQVTVISGTIQAGPHDRVFDAYRDRIPPYTSIEIVPGAFVGYGRRLTHGYGVGEWRDR